ncbi:MAG: tetratricopeptide repeat protein [Nitrospira sp.]|nr:tetratricopeptide repeat protein [Nitrospira sp.]MDR4463954.1 tetratricopeptide repeat protein [Nitrospira sp.]MDR4469415.1 tetratricopeptide repeat protein [Nitrospira sp.]
MASGSKKTNNAAEIDRLALAFAKEPGSKAFIPLAEEYGKAAMWEEAAAVLEDGLKTYPGFITAMVALGRAYDHMNQPVKAQAILEEAIKLSPENLRAHRTLAKLYAAQGANDAAIQSCNVILALHPQDQEALALRAGLEVPLESGATKTEGPAPDQRSNTAASDSGSRESRSSVKGGPLLVKANEADGLHSHRMSQGDTSTHSCPREALRQENPQRGSSSVVLKLEQWLRSIQARRHDSQHCSNPPTKAST